MTKRRVVVTGIGMISPLGVGNEPTWQGLLEGRSGVGPITKFDASDYSCRIAGEVKGFKADDWIDKKEVKKSDTFIHYAVAAAAMDRCAAGNHALHLAGLLSDGGVHSHQRHLHALLDMAARRGVPRIFVHAIMDGRDTSPTGGVGYLAELERALPAGGRARVASLIGRYYAMDRDKRWDRTKLAYDLLVATAEREAHAYDRTFVRRFEVDGRRLAGSPAHRYACARAGRSAGSDCASSRSNAALSGDR